MSKRPKQIECLERLDALNGTIQDILGFLREEKVITTDQVNQVRSSPMKGKELQLILSDLVKSEKLQLLEYEWVVLPFERITVTVVTDNSKREFTYSSF
jgi:hypothetical protein